MELIPGLLIAVLFVIVLWRLSDLDRRVAELEEPEND